MESRRDKSDGRQEGRTARSPVITFVTARLEITVVGAATTLPQATSPVPSVKIEQTLVYQV
jgi:hypothetical protein